MSHSWFEIPRVAFDSPVDYRIVGSNDWTVAHVAVIELGEDRCILIRVRLLLLLSR